MNSIKQVAALEPARKAFSLLEEFKLFAFKGTMIDLAVGVIIGAAFGRIIDSLVKNLVMPLLGAILPGDQGYVGWKWTINGQTIPYGLFLGEVVNFLIVALVLFIFIIKFLGWVLRERRAEAAAPQPPTRTEQLLIEIRDLLKEKRG